MQWTNISPDYGEWGEGLPTGQGLRPAFFLRPLLGDVQQSKTAALYCWTTAENAGDETLRREVTRMAQQGETSMDKELQTRIEAYVLQRAETLNIPIDALEWSEACVPDPDTAVHSASLVHKLRVSIDGRPQVLTFTAEECSALGLPEDHGAEAWPRLAEKIDAFLGAFAPKQPRLGY